MKILFLSNNEISKPLAEWLKGRADVFEYSKRLYIDFLKKKDFDLIISYNYKYIITKDIIAHYPNKIINLHISYLPWNRGAYPNVWSILKNTPKGVSIHLIDQSIDTGDILFQKEVFF